MNGLQVWDDRIFLAVNSWVGSPLDYVFGWPTHLITFLILPIVYIFMRIWEDAPCGRKFASVLAAGLAGSAAAQIVKGLFDRPRPLEVFYDLQTQGRVIRSLFGVYVSDSFPSAHTALAFGVATGLARVYPKQAPVFFILAAWLSFTRIYVGAHFPSDVAAGALLGVGTAFAATWAMKGILKP